MVQMLHSGSNWPQGANPVPSPSVPRKPELPSIRVLKFWSKYKAPMSAPAADELVTMDEEHWVEWVRVGEGGGGSSTSEAVKRIMPRPERNQPPRIEWAVIGPAYEAWRRGEETPLNGQALYAWAGATRELADALKPHGILTVEDLAAYPDHKLTNIPIPGLRELRNRAKVTIDMRGSNEIALEVARRDEQIALLQKQSQENAATMAAMQATMEAMKAANLGAVNMIAANMPHPDDEFVDRSNARPATGMRGEFVRRDPVDHVDKALGAVLGIHEVGDEDATD